MLARRRSSTPHLPPQITIRLKPIAKRVEARGKPRKCVSAAITCRLVMTENAILKTGIPWRLKPAIGRQLLRVEFQLQPRRLPTHFCKFSGGGQRDVGVLEILASESDIRAERIREWNDIHDFACR